jgi:hypothetical protein
VYLLLIRIDAICPVLEDAASRIEDGALTESRDIVDVGSIGANRDVKGGGAEVAIKEAEVALTGSVSVRP